MRRTRRETFRPVDTPANRHRHRAPSAAEPRRRRRIVVLPSVGAGALVIAVIAAILHGAAGTPLQPYSGEPVVAIVGDASARTLATGSGTAADAVGTGLDAQVVTRVDTTARYAAPATTVTAAATSAPGSSTPTSTVQVSTLAQQIPSTSKVVVLAAGERDGTASATQLQHGVLSSVHAVQSAAPRARLVLLAPVGGSAALHRALSVVAALKHLIYIDPMVCGWLTARGDLAPDGRTLTAEGRADLAAGLRVVLAQLANGSPQQSTSPATGNPSINSTASSTPSTTASSSASRPTADPSTSASTAMPTPADPSTPSSSPASRPAGTTATLPQLPAGSTAYFFGDSWTHGESATNLKGFPFMTASHFGWSPVVDGKSGSGYIHTTVASSPLFPARAAAVSSSIDPDVVVVEGGLNDRMSDLSTLRSAAQLTWSRLAAKFPGVPIVVVGPASPTLPVSSQLQQVDQILQQAATDAGLIYISPLQEHWFTASNVGQYIDAGTLHPNDAGHAYYATRLEADLVANMKD